MSEFFECSTGVRQGEICLLTCLPFLQMSLKKGYQQGLTLLANICCETNENSFKLLSTMFLLLYADDRIILA